MCFICLFHSNQIRIQLLLEADCVCFQTFKEYHSNFKFHVMIFEILILLHCRVDNALKQVYAKLTRTALLSGSAYLSLQDPEEPYLGGISFTAMPPTKRWRSMDQVCCLFQTFIVQQ